MHSQFISNSGRSVSSPISRGREKLVSKFSGLPDGIGPFDLLNLIERQQKPLSLSNTLLRHLTYLLKYTRLCDWQAGSKPIVYKTVIGMARDLGLSERQINNREHELHALGFLTWTDSGNFRRSGYRDNTGRIVSAYGVDLSPLAEIYNDLVDLADELEKDRILWDQTKRTLSATKKRLRIRLNEAQVLGLDITVIQDKHDSLPKITAQVSLQDIEEQIDCLNSWIEDVEDQLPNAIHPHGNIQENSDMSGQKLPTHTRYKQISISKRNSSPQADAEMTAANAADLSSDTEQSSVGNGDKGMAKSIPNDVSLSKSQIPEAPLRECLPSDKNEADHKTANISIETLIFAATPEFQQLFREQSSGFMGAWPAFIETAHRRCAEIGIHRSAWREACGAMGREQAALAVLIIDQNRNHPDTPIQSTGGVLRAMTERANTESLNLLGSLFSIIERKNERLQ